MFYILLYPFSLVYQSVVSYVYNMPVFSKLKGYGVFYAEPSCQDRVAIVLIARKIFVKNEGLVYVLTLIKSSKIVLFGYAGYLLIYCV